MMESTKSEEKCKHENAWKYEDMIVTETIIEPTKEGQWEKVVVKKTYKCPECNALI